MQLPRLGPAQSDDAAPSIDAAKALHAVECKGLAVAETGFRRRVQLSPRQACEQGCQRKETAAALRLFHSLQGLEADRVAHLEHARRGAPQGGDVAHAAERRGDILAEGADI